MEPLMFYSFALAIAAAVLPAALVLAVPSIRRRLAISIWLLAPPVTFTAVIIYETAASGGASFSISNALLGFSLISAIALLPWLFLSALGALIGLFLKWMIAKLK